MSVQTLIIIASYENNYLRGIIFFPVDNRSCPAVSLHHNHSPGEWRGIPALWTARICARRSLAARHRSKSPHLVSALLVSNYCCFRRCTVRVCERVRVCTKGLTALTCRKDVKSVITLADNKWFSRVWMCVSESLVLHPQSASIKRRVHLHSTSFCWTQTPLLWWTHSVSVQSPLNPLQYLHMLFHKHSFYWSSISSLLSSSCLCVFGQ